MRSTQALRMSFVLAVEKVVPPSLSRHLLPLAAVADSILYDGDDRSVSRRIAMFSFAVRVLSGVIAYLTQRPGSEATNRVAIPMRTPGKTPGDALASSPFRF